MADPASLGVAVIGLGFMGRTHINGFNAAATSGLPCRLVAVCDGDPNRLTNASSVAGNIAGTAGFEPLFDPQRVRAVTDPDEVFASPDIQIVSVCTYTDTHVPLALRALEAGKHVIVEKPVAVRADQVRPLAAAAQAAAARGQYCMPAMCMRFWPGWDWLHARIHDGAFGPVRSATFQRLVGPPKWATDFYKDPERSGGALVDLHIHDADFISWCFGRPSSVMTGGSMDHVTTVYRFNGPGGPGHVVAEGAWDLARSFGFRMRFTVVFEGATVDFDIGRDPRLLVHDADGSESVEIPEGAGYEREIAHFVETVAGRGELRATIGDAVLTANILDAERESLRTARAVELA